MTHDQFISASPKEVWMRIKELEIALESEQERTLRYKELLYSQAKQGEYIKELEVENEKLKKQLKTYDDDNCYYVNLIKEMNKGKHLEEIVALKKQLGEADEVINGIRNAVEIVCDHYLAYEEHASAIGVCMERESAKEVEQFWNAHRLFETYQSKYGESK